MVDDLLAQRGDENNRELDIWVISGSTEVNELVFGEETLSWH